MIASSSGELTQDCLCTYRMYIVVGWIVVDGCRLPTTVRARHPHSISKSRGTVESRWPVRNGSLSPLSLSLSAAPPSERARRKKKILIISSGVPWAHGFFQTWARPAGSGSRPLIFPGTPKSSEDPSMEPTHHSDARSRSLSIKRSRLHGSRPPRPV